MDNLDFAASGQDAAFVFEDPTDTTSHRPVTSTSPGLGPLGNPAFATYYQSSGWPLTLDDLEAGMTANTMQMQREQEQNRLVWQTANSGASRVTQSSALPLYSHGLGLTYSSMSQIQGMPQQSWPPVTPPHWQLGMQEPIYTTAQQSVMPPVLQPVLISPGYVSPHQLPSPTEYMQMAQVGTQPLHLPMAGLGQLPDETMDRLYGMNGLHDMSTLASAFPVTQYSSETWELPVNATQGIQIQTRNMYAPTLDGTSPINSALELASLSSSDNGWTAVNFPTRHSLDSYTDTANVFNPGQTLHIRTDSEGSSEDSTSAHLVGSYEDHPFVYSPSSDDFSQYEYNHNTMAVHTHGRHDHSDCEHHHHQSSVGSPSGSFASVSPVHIQPSFERVPRLLSPWESPLNDTSSPPRSSPSGLSPKGTPPTPRHNSGYVSPTPATDGSSRSKRRKTPPMKTMMQKDNQVTARKVGGSGDKKVGRRRGPLGPDQRKSAHEIRKLRACIRCKFLKKTCDKGDPCAGCKPSHARLWQVPCTRLDIRDLGNFVHVWTADYQRHVTVGFSTRNIKDYGQVEGQMWVTHGYGHYLPISTRTVEVVDDKCFGVDWAEAKDGTPRDHAVNTAMLASGKGGISTTILSEYIEGHLGPDFQNFVDKYFGSTPFLTDMLMTAHRYYWRTKNAVIRKALKLVVAYTLTQSITMVTAGLSEDESNKSRIDDVRSMFNGEVVAPVLISFEIKLALSQMWRELQKDILDELSSLYSSVYQGDKLRHWPTIFMLATIILGIWEMMQFDAHYREPDEKKVEQFCDDMEKTPVGVIVGLFHAISTKLPSFMDWDSNKHAAVLKQEAKSPICDALTEVRSSVLKHEEYLRKRTTDTKFDRNDFDSLSNKFLSRLVIRAN